MFAGPGAHVFGEAERKEVLDVIESGYLSRYGQEDNPSFKKKVYTLEKEFAKILGLDYCVAINSGTSSLLACMAALGIGPGDEVIVPGYTFVASISSIAYSKAVPVFAEINDSLTIDPADIKKKITKRTKAIMPVHMLGNPCDMDPIIKIAKENNLFVIEDCCQAGGASYKGRRVGTMGDIAGFSLNHYKTVSSGEGGMVATKDKELYERAFGFMDQGHKPNRTGLEIGHRSFMGLNFRMNELTGAVALAQVRKLEYILSELRKRKKKLKSAIKPIDGFKFRTINDEDGECATLLTLIFDSKSAADNFAAELGSKTVSNSGWHVYNNMEHVLNKKMPTSFGCPYDCPVYEGNAQYSAHMLPATDHVLERAVNISVGVVDKGLGSGYGINILSTDEEIEQVAANLNGLLKKHL